MMSFEKLDIKQWFRNNYLFIISVVFLFYRDTILSLPYANEILIGIILFGLYRTIIHYKQVNHQIQLGESLGIKSQNDQMERYVFAVLAMFALWVSYKESVSTENYNIELFTFGSLALLFIVIAMIKTYNVVLEYDNDLKLLKCDEKFKIKPIDKAVHMSEFQLAVIPENGKPQYLNEVIIEEEEAKRIKHWINSKIPNSQIEFYWKEDNKLLEI